MSSRLVYSPDQSQQSLCRPPGHLSLRQFEFSVHLAGFPDCEQLCFPTHAEYPVETYLTKRK